MKMNIWMVEEVVELEVDVEVQMEIEVMMEVVEVEMTGEEIEVEVEVEVEVAEVHDSNQTNNGLKIRGKTFRLVLPLLTPPR